MTAPAVTVRPDVPLPAVARLLDERGVTSLPVVDDHGHIVGMVSETDVVRDAVPSDPWAHDLHPSHGAFTTRVADVMTFNPITVPPDTELPVVADVLVTNRVQSLPVVEGGVVIGVISRRDIVAVLAHTGEPKEAGEERPVQQS
jgi:CBS domain-containing protein